MKLLHKASRRSFWTTKIFDTSLNILINLFLGLTDVFV